MCGSSQRNVLTAQRKKIIIRTEVAQNAQEGGAFMEFSEKLKHLRLSNGWSQEELAEKSGISRRTIQNYESGNMKPKKQSSYTALAEVFGVEERLLTDDQMEVTLKADRTVGRQAADLEAVIHALWAGGEVEEEDMDEIVRSLREAYAEAKQKQAGKRRNEGHAQ